MKEEPKAPKAPPHSIDAERGVLGSILIGHGGKAYEIVLNSGVREESFFAAENRMIFSCIKDMAEGGYPIDPMILAERLRGRGQLEDVGCVENIRSLIDDTPTSAHVEYYVSIIGDLHLKRMAIDAAEKIKRDAYKGDKSGDMIRSESEMRFAQMSTVSVRQRKKIGEIARSAVQAWEENANGLAVPGIHTGIKWLDDATAGILNGGYWVISGRPGSCKSTLCRMIAESVAAQGIMVAVKTTEQTEEQYVGAMVAALAKISVHKLNLPGFPVSRLNFLKKAESDVASWPLEIDGEMCTRAQLSSWYYSSVSRGSRLQILDYLQDVIPETKEERASPEQKISLCTQEMRRCSKVTGVPIVIVSTESNAGDLRYSGQIEYDASLWARMGKAEDFDPHTNPKYEVEIKKSRFAPSGTKLSLFYFYGKLLEENDYYTQLAIMSGMSGMANQSYQMQPQIP
jgi:replicative DNA helicase